LKTFKWPENFKAAVSLTFDDGLPSQLKLAIPLLERFGFKASFYLNPRGDYRRMLKPWREAAEHGHEIGNHTLTHPCSCNFQGTPHGRCLENMTLEEVKADIMEAQRRIREVIPGGGRTFAYPCYETSVGRGVSKRSYVPVVAEIFLAARGGGEMGWSNHPAVCDLHELWSWSADRMRFEEMVGLTLRTAYEGRWAVFTFHGIDEGHLPVSEYDLRGFLKFLDRYRTKIWVAPLVEIAEYVVEERRRLGIPV